MNSCRAPRPMLALFASIGVLFLGSAHAEVITRPVTGAAQVHFALPADLVIRQGAQEQLTVDADAKVLPRLDFIQRGDTLTLRSKGSFTTDQPIRIVLTVKTLRSLTSTASGSATVEAMETPQIAVVADGSGTIRLKQVRSERVQVELNGSGDVAVAGSGLHIRVSLAGSGSIAAQTFVAQHASASLGGSGDIKIHATNTLEASITGAGEIRYRGHPDVSRSITGAGSIEPL